MSDESVAPLIVTGILALAMLAGGIGILFGDRQRGEDIATQCDRQGEFVADGYRYKCERVGKES